MTPDGFSTERYYDYLTVNGQRFSGTVGPAGVTVEASSTITWTTDGSVVSSGWTLCASAPSSPNAIFAVVQSSSPSACVTTSGGMCFSGARNESSCTLWKATVSSLTFTNCADGPPNAQYGNDERCTISVLRSAVVSVVGTFSTEANFDYLTIGTERFDGNVGPNNVFVTSATTISWRSDTSRVRSGFVICGTPSVTPPPTAQSRQIMFVVTASSPSSACLTTSSGRCFTDGSGNAGNNERCTITVLQSTRLTTPFFK